VQIKLAPANGGGFALTHVRVTPPATYRTQGGASATKQHAAPSASAEAELATAQSEGPAVEEELRIEEVAPASGAAPSLPPKPTPASKTKADSDGVAAAQTDNEALFMPAAKFCGARAGYVFKRGKQGVGYYRDVAPAEQPGKKAVSFSGGNGASAATNSASPPPGPVDQASAAKKAAADALFAKGDAAGAANAYTELLSTMPPSTAIGHTALSNRSACHLALRDWSRCAEDCDEALTAARADLPARALVKLRLRRAEARLSMGLREMAAADVHEAERLRPSEDTTAKAQIEAFEERLKSATNPAVRANDVVGGRSAPPAKAKFDTVISGEAPNRTLTLNVPLPGVKSLADVTLELSNLSLNLLGEGVEIEAPLPFQVDSATASAKFSAKAGVLRIKAKESS
jgi:tetratricopeptide (TPR) repeat protein